MRPGTVPTRSEPTMTDLLALTLQAGSTLPTAATAVDQAAAYGAVALLVALVWWHHASTGR